MDLQFFAEKAVEKQSEGQLRKGIKELQERIQDHESKIANPKSVYNDWNDIPNLVREGRIRHWEKEISNFEESIQNRIDELKKRGEWHE